ncbi:MAG: hypothetical protein AAF492_23350 [Verrucomicrobiota bacterium]
MSNVYICSTIDMDAFRREQANDPELRDMYLYLASGALPSDAKSAKRISSIADSYALLDGILVHLADQKPLSMRLLVPS